MMAAVTSRTVKLIVAYDGTDFAGWQLQPRQRTVQGVLEAGLAKLLGRPVRVIAAGRTDAGVHAEGQVVTVPLQASRAAAREGLRQWPQRLSAPRSRGAVGRVSAAGLRRAPFIARQALPVPAAEPARTARPLQRRTHWELYPAARRGGDGRRRGVLPRRARLLGLPRRRLSRQDHGAPARPFSVRPSRRARAGDRRARDGVLEAHGAQPGGDARLRRAPSPAPRRHARS